MSSPNSLKGKDPCLLNEDKEQFSVQISSSSASSSDNNKKKCKASPESDDNLTSIKTEGSLKLQVDEINKNKNKSESQNILLQEPDPNNLYFLSSATETVLSFDHILDLIFLKCEDRSTLLACRLVSCRWAHLVTKQLHKTVNITFTMNSNQNDPYMLRTSCGRTVDDLIAVMNNSTDFHFPSTSFTFFDVNHKQPYQSRRIDRFLDTHGHSIKKLKLHGVFNLYDLKRLLLIQAPNLQILSIRQLEILKWTDEQRVGPADDFSETEESPQERFTQSLSLFSSHVGVPEPILKNLKVFKSTTSLHECIPEICFQQILKCAPNLIQVVIPHEYLPNLVRPVNRVELFKWLMISCCDSNLDQLSFMVNNHEGHLAIERMFLAGPHKHFLGKDVYSRSGGFLGEVLNGSADSCKTLIWYGFLTHFKIPQMPAVTDFSFTCWIVDGEGGRLAHVFERGVNLTDTFPNLKALTITWESYKGQDISVGSFFGVEDEVLVPVPSVRKVTLKFFKAPQTLFDGFKKMFPNAYIKNYISMSV